MVAEAVKEVYRDLLSATDKSLMRDQKSQEAPRESYTYVYDSSAGEDEKKK